MSDDMQYGGGECGRPQCVACGMVDPPGGVRLGEEGGGAEYEWFCKRVVDCVERLAAQVRAERGQ